MRLAADPASVPGARRFVADGLSAWGRTALVDDATLCVSELAANAALHSASTYMEIGLQVLEDVVRISVEDDGQTPTAAVRPRADFPGPDSANDLLLADEPTTGRGLAIVSILASDWGVEPLEHGKRIWADLSEGAGDHPVRPPRTTSGARTNAGSHAGSHAGPEPVAGLPAGWATVWLLGCPVELGLRQDQHLDELVRELQLIKGDGRDAVSQGIAADLEGLLSTPAHARHLGRRLSREAARQGRTHVDIEMAIPVDYGREIAELDEAVKAADALCEERRLLTLASSPEMRALRAWMKESVQSQLEHGAEPVGFAEWLRRQG